MDIAMVFVLLAAAWLVQMVLAWLQAQRFMTRVRKLRASGRVAIGSAGGRFRGRAFVALAGGPEGTVTAAASLRGLTVLARPKDVPALVGHTIADLARASETPPVPLQALPGQVLEAARSAASTLARNQPQPAPADVPSAARHLSNEGQPDPRPTRESSNR